MAMPSGRKSRLRSIPDFISDRSESRLPDPGGTALRPLRAADRLSPGAGVAKLVYARDLKSLSLGNAGSSPAARTNTLN